MSETVNVWLGPSEIQWGVINNLKDRGAGGIIDRAAGVMYLCGSDRNRTPPQIEGLSAVLLACLRMGGREEGGKGFELCAYIHTCIHIKGG